MLVLRRHELIIGSFNISEEDEHIDLYHLIDRIYYKSVVWDLSEVCNISVDIYRIVLPNTTISLTAKINSEIDGEINRSSELNFVWYNYN